MVKRYGGTRPCIICIERRRNAGSYHYLEKWRQKDVEEEQAQNNNTKDVFEDSGNVECGAY